MKGEHLDNLPARLIKNTGLMIAGRALRGLTEMFSMVILARYLGVANFGVYSFILAYLGFFSIIIDFGIDNILTREISKDRLRAGKLSANAIVIKLTLSIIAAGFACLFISIFDFPQATRILVYVASISFIFYVRKLYELIFHIDLRVIYPVIAESAGGILKLTLFFLLIFFKAPILAFILALLIVHLLEFITIKTFSRSFIKPVYEIDFRLWKYFFNESWPLAATAVFVMAYTRINQLLIFKLKGEEALGFFAAAVSMAEVFNIVIASFMALAFPLLSRYFKEGDGRFEKIYKLSFKYMFLFILPFAAVISVFHQQITSLIYGQRFILTAGVLSILIWSEVFLFFGTIQSRILIAANKQKFDFFFTGLTAVVNLIINLIFIPKFGIIGAAISTVISFVFTCTIGYFFAETRSFVLAGWQALTKPLFCSLAMFLFMVATRENPYLGISGGILTFAACALVIKGIDGADINLIRNLIWKQSI
ncbi:MAG: flippase [Candidatus Omnitrophota bacterium]